MMVSVKHLHIFFIVRDLKYEEYLVYFFCFFGRDENRTNPVVMQSRFKMAPAATVPPFYRIQKLFVSVFSFQINRYCCYCEQQPSSSQCNCSIIATCSFVQGGTGEVLLNPQPNHLKEAQKGWQEGPISTSGVCVYSSGPFQAQEDAEMASRSHHRWQQVHTDHMWQIWGSLQTEWRMICCLQHFPV